MVLLLRLLPLLAATGTVVAFWYQRILPAYYPWLAVAAIGFVLMSVAAIAFRRLSVADVVEKMFPSVLCLAAAAFAMLLVETSEARLGLTVLAGIAAFLPLELLFLLAYEPSAYPVNGLSRVNLAALPIATWLFASTSLGLIIFLHTPRAIHVVLLVVCGLLFFRTTGHPGATPAQNRVWMAVGALLGLQVGWFGLLAPLGVEMQGFVAAFVLACAARLRRYAYSPKPHPRLAVIEGVGAVAMFLVAMATAKWA
jgi:hypothetical protein